MANEINRIAELLLDAWKKADPKSSVALHPTSYVATFADMAKAIIEDRNTRPAAPVEGLEKIGYVHKGTVGLLMEGAVSKAVIVQKPGGDFKHPVVFADQAEAIIAAERSKAEEYYGEAVVSYDRKLRVSELEAELATERAESERLRTYILRAEKAEADNAAQAARIKELTGDRDSWRRVAEKLAGEKQALEAKLAAATDLISRAKEIIPDSYINWHDFARAALGGKP